MAFYKDYSKDKKKKDHAAEGSWDDEGTHYKSAPKGPTFKSGKPAFARPARRPDSAAPAGEARPYGRPASRGEYKPAGDRPAFRDRPERAEGDRKPYGRPASRGEYKPAGDRPAFRGRPERAEGERKPYDRPAPRSGFGPASDRPAFRDRPEGERKPYGKPAPRGGFGPGSDRPAFRDRPESDRKPYGRPAPRGSFGPAGDRPAPRFGPAGDRPVPSSEYRPAGDKPAFRGRPAERTEESAYKRHEYKPAAPAPAPVIPQEEEITPNENLLSGRNPIREAIKSGRDIEKLLVARGDLSGSAREIVAMAHEARIPVQEVDRARLDEITRNHQGLLAFASAYQYSTVDDMLAEASEKNEAPFLLLLDGITDPHNLGAIIRTAECVGAHGVIVPERRSVGLTPAAVKASAGAVEHVKVARVGNLTRTMEELKTAGLWIAAAATDGESYQTADLSGPLALVIGSEGEGISRLVREHCDKAVSLPLKGQIGSLNASVAAGVLMYAVLTARNK